VLSLEAAIMKVVIFAFAVASVLLLGSLTVRPSFGADIIPTTVSTPGPFNPTQPPPDQAGRGRL
jgi:hypothetical protein